MEIIKEEKGREGKRREREEERSWTRAMEAQRSIITVSAPLLCL